MALKTAVIGWSLKITGLGFDTGNLNRTKGGSSGLCIMDERARLLGGNMKIDSKPGQYTRIIVQFPDHLGGMCDESNDS